MPGSLHSRLPMVVGTKDGEAGDAMAAASAAAAAVGEPIERASLCLPDITRGVVTHQGEDGFGGILKQYYDTPENDALERLVVLKKRLRETTSNRDFWTALLREVCDIGHAQCGFVAKPADADSADAALGMPLLGAPGSDIMGVGFYLNSGGDVDQMHHNYRYHVQGTSCVHMQNDKVFLIPERLTDFVKDGWDKMPWENSEAYLGIPISRGGGNPVAHFAMVWTAEGAAKRKLSWAFLEMFMHGLEDMILARLLEYKGSAEEAKRKSTRIVPIDAITASQTLKPYARSLSHELRSPMQGVVGMLDMMYSTVVDAIASQMYPKAASVFEELKTNMETAQDSSKRAVEAVDNVVHAYDLNMQMPETPLENNDSAELANPPLFAPLADPFRFDIIIEGSGIPLVAAANKRQRDDEVGFHPGPPMKRLPSITEGGLRKVYDNCSSPATSIVAETDDTSTTDPDSTDRQHFSQSPSPSFPLASPDGVLRTPAVSPPPLFNKNLSSDRRQVSTRPFIRTLVDQAIRSMRPISKHRVAHPLGETLYVKTASPRGAIDELTITVLVSPEVPPRIITKELHLTFAVMKVVDNAIKFTPRGAITVHMRLSRNRQLVEISVTDTGCGIAPESLEHLFKPHFQEDATISRSRDGLGLSLFNAKAHVRRSLRGEMTLERSDIEGPAKGSEFLIRFPLETARERAASMPLETPTPTPTMTGTTLDNNSSSSSNISPCASPHLQAEVTVAHPAAASTNGYPSPALPSPGLPSLPLAPLPPPALSSTRSQRPKKPSSSTIDRDLASRIPLSILIAEDNAVNRRILVGYLSKLGYGGGDVAVAFDGAEAVEMYRASLGEGKRGWDAVLMDLWMPNVDGYEATERILEISASAAAARMEAEMGMEIGRRGGGEAGPVVFAVSADITSDSLARARGAGMRGFVSKPYRVVDIQKLIVEHFGDREIIG